MRRIVVWRKAALMLAALVMAEAVLLSGFAGESRADWDTKVVTETSAPAVTPDSTSAVDQTAAAKPDDDYYTRRAKSVLANEAKRDTVAPHPLAAAYPGQTVVVCEAGCPRGRAEIVFMKPNAPVKAVMNGSLEPTSATAAEAPVPTSGASNVIECMGGCYDTVRAYAVSGQPVASTLADFAWKTTLPAEPRKRDALSPVR